MVEKLKKIKTKQIVMFSVLAFMLLLVVGTTYAYFTAKVIGNDEAKNTQVYAGIMSLKLDGTQELNASNMLPGATKEVEFSVENTGTLTTTYELDMKEVYNDFVSKDELIYTLEQDGTIILNETEAPSIDEVILPAVVINKGEKQTYKLKLTFKETGDDQNENQNKTFSGKVQINGIDSSNYLQAKVLARSINTNEPDFTTGDPVYLYEEVQKNEADTKGLATYLKSKEFSFGKTYEFEPKTAQFILRDVNTEKFDKSVINRFICINVYEGNDHSICSTMIKILEVEETDAENNYDQVITENQSVSYTSDADKIVSDNYHIDQETGYYILDNPSEVKSYNQSDIGKYTCNNTTSKCSTMYKINSVTDTTVNNVDTYTSKGNYNKLTKAILYESNKTSKIYSQSGMYKAEDDDGESYYFRGKIDNNYVSFANNLWRIVRINGDGSIRLILEGLTTKRSISMFYTRNNERICNSSNPCDNNVGIASPAKKNLQTWYENTLVTYDDKIVESRYCNDTSFVYSSDDRIYYGAYKRLHDTNKPILKCPETQSTSGGAYKLKIGLLSADEANMAGLGALFPYSKSNETNYLTQSYSLITMSLGSSTVSGTLFNIGFTGSIAGQYHNTSFLRPVINLKSDIKITSGDGSKSNPYVVE